MGFVIEAVARYQAYIYAVCGLVALYHIYKVWVVRSERRQAVFSLEREKALRELLGIFYVAMLLLGTMGITYFVSNTLAAAVEPLVAESRNPQPNLPFVSTPTPTPLPVTPTEPAVLPTPTAPVSGTVTAGATGVASGTPAATTPTPAAAPTPQPPPLAAAPGCSDPGSTISSPGNGQSVSGLVSVVGTATHESFQYYKVEFAPGANADGGFVYLGGGSAPVQGGVLANVDTNALGPGTWTLRLVVVDQTGNFPPPCTVTVNVGG
ncbi:MAG: hypothetical protein ACRC1H_15345 [Caldilineaceae bacterium]